MADSTSISDLQSEIRILERLFGKEHPKFRFLSETIDEVHCKFVKGDEIIEINGNLPDFYPQSPPLWFSNDAICDDVITALRELIDNRLVYQVKMLLTKLCGLINCPLPDEVKELDEIIAAVHLPSDAGAKNEETDDLDSDEEMESLDESDDLDFDETVKKVDEVMEEQKKIMTVLEKVESSGQSSQWTRQATNRLHKEILELLKSDSFKNKVFTLELANDSIYDWNVRLLQIDTDSPLHADLMKLQELGKRGDILLNVTFPSNYPFEPPFVRVVEPVIERGHVLNGGSMCMELLMTQGWSSVYTAEAVILQVAATIVRGEGRVNFTADNTRYTLQAAKRGFAHLMKIPDQGRWTSQFKDG